MTIQSASRRFSKTHSEVSYASHERNNKSRQNARKASARSARKLGKAIIMEAIG